MTELWVGIRFAHLVAMAFFVGGQLLLAVAVVPVLRTQRPQLAAVARRFGYATLAAIGVLILSGVAMAVHFNDFHDTLLQIKLGLVALVSILIIWHIRRPNVRALDATIFLVSLAIVWLGIAIAH